MENSPLELYETAYRLHYSENKVPEALKYYEALIREFPESNECGYAVVQIQKIKSNDVADSITAKGKAHPLAALSFLLSLLTVLALAACVFFLRGKLDAAQKQASYSAMALGRAINGDDAGALRRLDEMKLLSGTDITPYDLSAQIYRRAGKMEQAKKEYEAFFAINPNERGRYDLISELVPEQAVEKKSKRGL
jgi:tetratricopeptide (TPR) repeat protein